MKTNCREEIFKSSRTVLRLRDIGMLIGEENPDNLKAKTNYYVLNGVVKNIRKGIYVKDGYSPDELACRIYSPSYISLTTVLLRSGVIFQYSSVITAISYLSRAITVDGNNIEYRKLKNAVLVNTDGIIQKQNVNIATPERALLDTLYLNGNYYFDNMNIIDKDKVIGLLKVYNCRALEKRVRRLFKND